MVLSLIPKFKYNYNLADMVYATFHVRHKSKTDNINKFFSTDNIYFTNYARTALLIILKSISKGRVLNIGVQAFTCHTVFETIRDAGCRPVFIDINSNYTLDLFSLKQKIEGIDLLIITHTFGIPAHIDEIKQIAGDKIIIEDCAHSLFSEYKSKPTGTLCDASIFSFGYGKYPSIGPGGFLVINDNNLVGEFEKLYRDLPSVSIIIEYINILRNYLYSKALNRNLYGIFTYPIGKKLDKKYDFIGKKVQLKTKGFVSNINIFLKNFSRYKLYNEIQRQNGKYFSMQMGKFIKAPDDSEVNINYYIFPLSHIKRDFMVDVLFKNGIESGKHFSKSIEWAIEYGYISGSCPNTERIVNSIFTLPSYYSLKKSEIKKTADLILGSIN